MSPIKEAVAPYLLLAKNIGMDLGVPYTLILAIIYRESSGNQWATRFEPNYKYLYHPERFAIQTTLDTEITHQKTSWSLMQTMGVVAREHGFKEPLPSLCQPAKAIYWGASHLANLQQRWPHLHDTISAYNQGSPRRNEAGEYENQVYVDYVVKYMSTLIQEGV